MTHLLESRSLSVRYGATTALDGFTMHLDPGELVGLIGPNGAGKTTCIDALTGFAASSGQVLLDGVEIQGLPAQRRIRRGLARTWQAAELFDELTVRENLEVAASDQRFLAQMAGLVRSRHAEAEAVDRALDLLNLGPHADQLPDELTQGQRKLVDVARAVAGGGQVLCLDEPAAGLDSDESLELGDKLRTLVTRGLSILLVDHDMGLVLSACDRVYVLDLGRLLAHGTPEEIRNSRQVIEAYLGEDEQDPDHAAEEGVTR